MAKRSSKSKTEQRSWIQGLDEQEVREALKEATVDAYGDDEQHTGLLTAIQDELVFPFRVSVLGEEVSVVDMEWPEGDEYGLDLVCERNGKRHRIEARSVELLKPLPEGHLFLAAYLDWKRRM
ncbi:MAG: cytoplasmic protein [Planctomycetaceae bacterium]|nr:cytoplasmic protein [Planctomycetaceae bacterium]